jgi:hypothetical protein
MNPVLATPEDQTEWMVISVEKEALERRLGAIHARRGEIAGRAMAIHLQAGKWVIQRSYMVAVDKRARLQIGAILSTALQLGYHDQFTLFSTKCGEDDGVGMRLEGRIDDGDVSLLLIPRDMSKALTEAGVSAAMKTLGVDVDLSAFVEEVRTREYDKAQRAMDEARRTLDALSAPGHLRRTS